MLQDNRAPIVFTIWQMLFTSLTQAAVVTNMISLKEVVV